MGEPGGSPTSDLRIDNLIAGERRPASSGEWLDKLRPADGTTLCRVARSAREDVDAVVAAARAAQPAWAERTAVERGDIVRELALLLRDRRQEASELVVEETGKPLELALGETDAAVEMGLFVAGEGRRSYGRTTTASTPHRTVLTVRQPLGVAALITSFNTPLPNIAWKAFPAIFCGNAAVAKPSEHTPASALMFAELALVAGVPPGSSTSSRGSARRRAPHWSSTRRSISSASRARPPRGAGSTRPPPAGWRRCASSSGGRTRSSSATTRTWRTRRAGSSPRRSRTPDSAAPRQAASWSSTRCTTTCATGSSPARERSRPSRSSARESRDRILAAVAESVASGATLLAGGDAVESGWRVAPAVLEGVAPDAEISRTSSSGR